MEEKNEKIINRIQEAIDKIEKKENRLFFFVYDTKGTPSGSLEYIYRLANLLAQDGYDVTMLHQEEEFVGVADWLGEPFASLNHENVSDGNIQVSPADIIFIPEVFAQVMNQTKNLPCKRIAILENYSWMLEQMPFAAKWNTFGIGEAIVNTEENANKLKQVFPAVKTHIINPYIDSKFGTTSELKNMVINIVAPNQNDIAQIVKPFYWKYPNFNWVSFKDLRGLSKEAFAKELREGVVTIWVDENANFGYAALEAIRSGAIVMAKVPKQNLGWNVDQDGNLKNCCIWFDNYDFLHKQIASVVRAWVTDSIPTILEEEGKKVSYLVSEEITKKQILNFVQGVNENRKNEMLVLINNVKENKFENGEK